MSTGSYASLTSGLLARKGEARPSAEQNVAAVLRTPAYKAPQLKPPIEAADLEEEVANDALELDANPVAEMKVKIDDAFAMWPAKKPARAASGLEDEMWKLDQRLSLPPSSRHTERTSVRFTHAQARALRLAALLLDRPQQDLIEAGLEGKLEALACTDLANCTCFKAVLATLEKR
jgi:hypothetical protein